MGSRQSPRTAVSLTACAPAPRPRSTSCRSRSAPPGTLCELSFTCLAHHVIHVCCSTLLFILAHTRVVVLVYAVPFLRSSLYLSTKIRFLSFVYSCSARSALVTILGPLLVYLVHLSLISFVCTVCTRYPLRVRSCVSHTLFVKLVLVYRLHSFRVSHTLVLVHVCTRFLVHRIHPFVCTACTRCQSIDSFLCIAYTRQ